MTPCRGCKENMSEPQGTFKMRFIGRPDGKTMKGAPRNYEHGKVYKMPYRHSQFPFWELIEPPPKLVAPELGDADDVFDEAVFIPPEDDPLNDDPVEPSDTYSLPQIDEDEGEGDEPSDAPLYEASYSKDYMDDRLKKIKADFKRDGVFLLEEDKVFVSNEEDYDYSASSTSPSPKETVSTAESVESEEDAEPAPVDELDRDALKHILDTEGVEYSKYAHTSTLRKMVEELAEASSEE